MIPIPAPTDLIFKSAARFDPKNFFPSSRNIALSERIIYEYLGNAWRRLKNIFTDTEKPQTQPAA